VHAACALHRGDHIAIFIQYGPSVCRILGKGRRGEERSKKREEKREARREKRGERRGEERREKMKREYAHAACALHGRDLIAIFIQYGPSVCRILGKERREERGEGEKARREEGEGERGEKK
jgi:translation initiation factor IF-3